METPETAAPAAPVVSNIRTQSIGGVKRKLADVKVDEKTITFRELDVVDSWNLAAITPEGATSGWRNLALLALAVTDVDGKPTFTQDDEIDPKWLRTTMRLVGSDGLAAVATGMAEMEPASMVKTDSPEDAHKRAVGKSLPSAVSGN